MLTHVLLIALILGFALVAIFWARGIIRHAVQYGSSPEAPLSSIWIFGTGSAAMASFLIMAAIQGPPPTWEPITDPVIILYPPFALLMIAGSFTLAWCALDTKNYRAKVRRQIRDKERAQRQRRRRRTVSSVRAPRPLPRTRSRR